MTPEPIESFSGEFRFLSNFWKSPLIYKGEAYPTSEHAFQAAKAKDEADRRMIQHARTPGEAKRLGRKVKMRADWESVKLVVMRRVIRAKFRDPGLRRLLMATDDRPLVEGNTWGDRVWGVCGGEGQNRLGRTLMAERRRIREKTR
jgi:ribA/ribD-fused uncharacterized protein